MQRFIGWPKDLQWENEREDDGDRARGRQECRWQPQEGDQREAADGVEREDVPVPDQQHVAQPEREQRDEPPYEEGGNADVVHYGALGEDGHPDSEEQREECERLELQ